MWCFWDFLWRRSLAPTEWINNCIDICERLQPLSFRHFTPTKKHLTADSQTKLNSTENKSPFHRLVLKHWVNLYIKWDAAQSRMMKWTLWMVFEWAISYRELKKFIENTSLCWLLDNAQDRFLKYLAYILNICVMINALNGSIAHEWHWIKQKQIYFEWKYKMKNISKCIFLVLNIIYSVKACFIVICFILI